jgi:hypothetical protein
MSRRRTRAKVAAPVTAEPSKRSPLLTVLLVAFVAFAGWSAYGSRTTPGPGPDNPVPVPVDGVAVARTVCPTIARLQAENYAKAAARLEAGDSIMAVNEELQKLNASAIDAAYQPLDDWMAPVLTDATPEATAAVYKKLSEEFARAP